MPKTPNFERSLKSLEHIVRQLEGGELSLEESLKIYEEGIRLTRKCEKELSAAEQKVQQLMENNGEIEAKAYTQHQTESEASDANDDDANDNDLPF